MHHALSHPAPHRALWLPPGRMRQYAIARATGGVLFAAIFAGWMVLQWSNITMRIIAASLIALTAWVTVNSIATDARRMRGRQVECLGDALLITTPNGEVNVRLDAITHATWSEEADGCGLAFYDRNESQMARIDENIIADEPEARAFLRWLRTHVETKFEVKWN